MGVRRDVFDAVGGFAEDLGTVGEDVELTWRLQLAGHELHFEPRALVRYRHRHTLSEVWRQHAGYGAADPVLYERFRSHGVPARKASSVAAAYARLLRRLPETLDADGRGRWLADVAKYWGRLQQSRKIGVWYL
jgi:GT2 family glycosyltransferase